MKYSFAGFIFDIRLRYREGECLCERYLYTGEEPADFVIEVSDAMIEAERQFDLYHSTDGLLESLAAYREICNRLFAYDCIFMHCSAIAYKNNGILFTAPSGTGKSTHSALWQKYFGDDVVMVNDDKPLLRFMNGEIYVCGTPWDGKHHRSNNIMVPVKSIVVLSQGKENEIEPASKQDVIYHLLNQTIRPENPADMAKVLDFCEKIINTVPVYRLKCNISPEAVSTVYNRIKENFNED